MESTLIAPPLPGPPSTPSAIHHQGGGGGVFVNARAVAETLLILVPFHGLLCPVDIQHATDDSTPIPASLES